MSIDQATRTRLTELGYLVAGETNAVATQEGVRLFQLKHGLLFHNAVAGYHKRAASIDGLWGPACAKLLEQPRDCSCPDIARADDGSIIEEARWPDQCATELEFSAEFSDIPGLNKQETRQGILLALAEWNTAFDSPLNGKLYDKYLEEFVRIGGDAKVAQWVLWVGTVKHEVGHALGFNHTPGDSNSVMYPSMRGQWMLNKTDLSNMSGRGYSKHRPIKMKVVEWRGASGTHIWARKGALPGSVLAWSMLAQGSCGQRAEQKYDTTISWNRTRIELPPVKPTPSPPPDGGVIGRITVPRDIKSGEVLIISTDKNGNGGWL